VRRDERQPLAAYLTDWLARIRPMVKPLTWQRYQELVRGISPTLGRTALAKLTPAQMERLYAERLAVGLSPTTVHQLHNVLHHALSDAVRKGLIARNVCDLVDAPKARHAQVQALTVEQARLLEAAAGDRLHALYVLALTTGLRQGELLGLHWADVNLESRVI
jgi:integrase